MVTIHSRLEPIRPPILRQRVGRLPAVRTELVLRWLSRLADVPTMGWEGLARMLTRVGEFRSAERGAMVACDVWDLLRQNLSRASGDLLKPGMMSRSLRR